MANEFDDLAAEIAPKPKPASATKFDDQDLAGVDALAQRRDQALDATLRQSVPVSPDAAAKSRSISLATGVPVDVVDRNPEQMQTQARILELNSILAQSPILARQMADPAFAKLAHDDAENLSLFERTLAMPRSLVAGAVADLPAALYGWGEGLTKLLAPALDPLAGTILPENPLRRVAAGLEAFRKQSTAAGNTIAGPQGKGLIESGISSGFRSVGNMAPGVALAVATGNPQFALAPGTAIQGGQSVSKGLDTGLPPVHALTYGIEDAAAEYATELLPMGVLLKDIKASAPFWKILGHQIATEVPTELAATAWQNFNEWANIHPDQPFKKYLDELPEAEAQTVIATITATVLTAGFGRAVVKHQERADKARETQASDLMQKLFEIAKDDELRRRSPTDFKSFVQNAAEEHGSGHVYVDAATFAQAAQAKGFDVAAAMPVTAAQMHEAIAMKGDLRIPIGEATTALPGTGMEQVLFQEMRVSPDAPTLKESQDKAYAQETQAAVEQVMAEQNFNEALTTSRMAVENEFLAMHEKAGRFTTDVNKVYAKMDAAFLATMGARVGLTPEQMYVRYGREIKSKIEGAQGANVMGQTPAQKHALKILDKHPIPAAEAVLSPEARALHTPNVTPVLATAKKNQFAFNTIIGNIAQGLGAQYREAAVKKMDRAVEKVAKDYGGNATKLKDALRSTLIVKSAADVPAAIEAVSQNFEIDRIKDRFATPTESGYSDVLINVKLPDGAIAEIQVTTPQMLDAKKLGHKLYKVERTLPAGDPRIAVLRDAQRRLYDEARAVNSSAETGVPSANTLAASSKGRGEGSNATQEPSGSLATAVPSTSNNLASLGSSIDPNLAQAKAGVYGQETIDNDTGALDEKPPFYSALSMQVAAAKMNNAPAAQWKSYINSLSTKGVKKDEIAMSGVLDWLDTIGKPIVSEEVVKEISARRESINAEGEEPKLLVQGKQLYEWLTDEDGGGLLDIPALKVADAILDARQSSRLRQSVNWRDANLHAMSALGIRDEDAIHEMSTGDALALRAIGVLKDLDAAGEVRFEDHKSTAVVPVEAPAPAEPQKKPDTRVSKQQVVDYLAENGVRVVTKILGAPESEQEDAKPAQPATTVLPAFDLPDGFGAVSEGNEITLTAPTGATTTVASPNEAIVAAQDYEKAQQTLGSLPDDYEVAMVDGDFVITYEPDSENVGIFSTRSEAMEAINEHYSQHEGFRGEPSEEAIEEKAKEILREEAPEIAREYANSSEYVNYAFQVALRPPTYEIVKVEGSLTPDMFGGDKAHDNFRVVQLTFDELPGDSDVVDTDGTRARSQSNMPDDADEFFEMFGNGQETRETVGPEFVSRSEAHAWAEQNVDNARDKPVWILWDRENYGSRHDPESGDNEGEFEDFADAHAAGESNREGRYDNEVENTISEIEDLVYMDMYLARAREYLENEEASETFWTQSQIDAPVPVRGWTPRGWNQVESKKKNPLALQHANNYQSKGGFDYRELVLAVPNIEPYKARDSTHFGHVFEGRQIAWARAKVHDDARKTPVFFIEEIQSQRAQAGRDEGFKGTPAETKQQQQDLAEIDAKSETAYAAWEDLFKNKLPEEYKNYANSSIVEMRGLMALPDDSAEDKAVRAAFENESVQAAVAAYEDTIVKRQEIQKRFGDVPTAPFVQNTQAWTALTFKRLLRYAVDKGYTRVAWTPGVEQVDRYEGALRKAVTSLSWKKTEKGIEFVADGTPVKRNRNDTEQATFTDRELRSVVGPSISQQVINDPNQEGVIEGKDIKLDDLWPAGFYGDEHGLNANGQPAVLTIVANKILKDLGGGGVKKIGMDLKEDDKEYDAAPGFEITPAMAEKIKGGQKLFQQNRGQISFGSDIKAQPSVTTLLEHADLSTYIHESGHFYLEVLADMAAQPDAPVDVQADMQRVLDWFGVINLSKWNEMQLEDKRPYHERFARGFERYIFEGKAPSIELAGMFSRFRAWMLNVYREITKLNVEVTDEVRGVFDRMLASNDEIVQAEAARFYAPLFKTAEEMGATADEWKAYQEQAQEATQEAVNLLESRALRDMKWLSNAKSRVLKKLQREADSKRRVVHAEVEKEVRRTPIYAALRFLTHGDLDAEGRSNKDRKLIESFTGMKAKLSIPALKELYGDGPAAPWRYLNAGKFGTLAAEDGLDPNMVAELFGFTSGDHLVKEILAAEPEDQVVDAMTDKRMLERYGDMTNPGVIEEAANAAIHNEVRAKFLATELRALAKATGQKNILVKAAKEFAATLIDRKKIVEIRPAQYTAAEARAGRNAERSSNLVEKATEKRNQIINHYAARAAYDGLDYVEKNVAYLRRIGDSKTIDPEYREQIQALLDRFELRPLTNKDTARRETLLAWVDDQVAKGFEPVIDTELLNEAKRVSYKQLPLEEFRGLVDAVKNIEHLGRLKHRLLAAQDAREFAVIVAEAAASITQHAKRTVPQQLEHNTWLDKMKSGTAEYFAMHRKFSMMIRELDGYADDGVLTKLFLRGMNESGDRESVRREEATKKLSALLKPVLDQGAMKQKLYIPAINASLSREGRIMVALNMGTEGNFQRLLDGDHWTPDQAKAVLDTLTKPEMDFVQEIWNFIGEFKDEIGTQQKRITGVAPEWVEPRPLQTKHGEYAGGYIPAKYDTTRSTRSLSDEAVTGIMEQWRAKRGAAKTRDTFTRERANKVMDRPLRKDFGVITQHVTEVTHRLSWQDWLIDSQRLLRAKPLDNAIRDHYGAETLNAMRSTLEDIAAGELGAQNAFEAGLNYLRTGATIAGLGYRITTALLQPIGLTQSMVRIGPKWVGAGLAEWLGDAVRMENTAKRIYEKSSFMRLRGKTMQREISEIRNKVADKNSALESSYFYLIQKMQLVADIPTWLGQYHKAVENGADEKGAVAQADQAVIDAQGSGMIKDLAGIQRGGPLLKLFTNFYSFFSTTYNLTSEAVGRTRFSNPFSVGRLAVDLLLLYSVPAVLGTLMKAALHSGDSGADDEKKLLRQLISDQLTYLFGTMVGLREVSGAIQTAFGLPGDYRGPASVRFFADMAEVGKQINQGEIDEAFWKAINNTAGVLFHYPAGQIGATVDGIVTMADGRTDNPGALVVGSNRK